MAAIQLQENVYWVGAQDPNMRNFHGYLTPDGTTYNAYLVMDEKISLIDTVREPFYEEMLDNIRQIVDPAEIDYLISNHVEPDHSGCLPFLVRDCPKSKVITSPNGHKGLKAYYGDAVPDDLLVVKTGDTLNTGRYTFRFVLMPMVHWPDSMGTYLEELKILFPNDALGQHMSGKERFDDELGWERLLERSCDYYANIVLPFAMPVQGLLKSLSGIDIQMIAPSHGVVLRSYVAQMVKKYDSWSRHETDPHKAIVIYDTMWGATKVIAERIMAEWEQKGLTVRCIRMRDSHVSAVMGDLLEASHIAIGSSTLNRQVMPTMAAFLSYLRGLAPKERVGRAFGAYGWSGESVGIIEETMQALKWEMEPSVKINWK